MPTGRIKNVERRSIRQLYDFYEATEDGKIYDRLGNELPVFENDNGKYITVDLGIYGIKTFSVALLTALAFRNVRLDHKQCEYLDVLFKDGNPTNVHADNTVLKYPENGLEHPVLKGYFYIPGYSNYVIDKDYKVFSLINRSFKENAFNHRGYSSMSALRDGGFSFNTSKDNRMAGLNLHRAAALTFIPYPSNVEEMDVDHIYNDPSKSGIENLQWLSKKENVSKVHVDSKLRATELLEHRQNKVHTNAKTVYVKDLVSGEIKEYLTLHKAAEEMKCNNNALRQAIRGIDEGKLTQGRYQVSYDNYFPLTTTTGKRIVVAPDYTKGRPTVVKNVTTGQITVFKTAMEAVREYGLSKKVVTTSLKNQDQRLIGLHYIFQYEDQLTDWVK